MKIILIEFKYSYLMLACAPKIIEKMFHKF